MFKSIASRSKVPVFVSLSILLFVAGFMSHDTITHTYQFWAEMFSPKPVQYSAPLSEYERKVNELFASQVHQVWCKHEAEEIVSIDLAEQYLAKYQELSGKEVKGAK